MSFYHRPEAGRAVKYQSFEALARRIIAAVAVAVVHVVVAVTAFTEPVAADPFNLEAVNCSIVDFKIELVAILGQVVVEDPFIAVGYSSVCYCHIIATDLDFAAVALDYVADWAD